MSRRPPLSLALTVLLAALLAWPARAQEEGSQGEAGDGSVIHVVQPGENLYRIAQRYEVTIDAIVSANRITDPRRIYPGQELLIPDATGLAEAGEVIVTHVVQPGDTLLSLTYRYDTSAERIAELNHLVNGGQLYAGQTLNIAQGGAPIPRGYLYTAQPGDNILSLAQRYGVSLQDIARANHLDDAPILFPNQRLVIPGGADAPALVELPDPILDFTLDPLPATQGRTLGMRVRTGRPAVVTGAFMGRPIAFGTADGLQHGAVFGVHPLTARGLYPLMVFVRDEAGALVHVDANVLVTEAGYGSQVVNIPARLHYLLDESVMQPELDRLAGIMTVYNPERYWGDGAFHRPAAGRVTSPFGTWRSYAGLYETFHAGMDLGSPIGAPIYAPAAGRVVFVDTLAVRGLATIIDHGWGVYSGFWHQSSVNVEVGQMVEAGQVIGAVGNTGLSTGAHMHWEMWVSGVQVDPAQWLDHIFP